MVLPDYFNARSNTVYIATVTDSRQPWICAVKIIEFKHQSISQCCSDCEIFLVIQHIVRGTNMVVRPKI